MSHDPTPRHDLDRLIGAVPPSSVDVDAVIGRVRRRRKLRRLSATCSAAVVVLAAVLAGTALTGGHPHRPAPVALPAPASASAPEFAAATASAATPDTDPGPVYASVPPTPSPTLATGTDAQRQDTLQRLRAGLEGAVARYAPGTGWIYMPDVPGEKRTPDGHPAMWLDKDPLSFEGRSGITRGGQKGGLYVSVRPTACDRTCSPLYECKGGAPICEETHTATGLPLVHYVDKPGNSWVFYGSDVVLPSGDYHVALTVVNYFGGDGSKAVTKAPLLSRAELDAVATDIATSLAG